MLLIICRDNVVSFEKYINSLNKDRLVCVATDNILIQKLSINSPAVSEIYSLSNEDSFFVVADKVLFLREKINNWLKKFNELFQGISNEHLYFNRHVEGGYTSQRLQDILILINSYKKLLSSGQFNEVVILKSELNFWEDDVLIQFLISRRITVNVISTCSLIHLKNRLIFYLRPFLFEPYYLYQYISIRILNFSQKRIKLSGNEIIVQVVGNAKKHIENVISIVRYLKNDKYIPVILSWRSRGRSKEFKNLSQRIDYLEMWLPLSLYFKSIFLLLKYWVSALLNRRAFETSTDFIIDNFNVSNLLWPSIRYFVFSELGKRLRISAAANLYFQSNQPIAISPWGINDLPEGKVVLDILRKYKRPFIFKYYLSLVMYESPYRIVYDFVDLYLVSGKYQFDFNVNKLGIPSDKNAVVGQPRYSNIPSFKSSFTKIDSLNFLQIPTNYRLYILFDLNTPLRGYISNSDQNQSLHSVIKITSQLSDVALIIKPHPNLDISFYRKSIAGSNIFILEPSNLPYHALNASDVLITKYSTLAIESMIFNKPVISIILDNTKQWRVFSSAACYFDSLSDFENMLKLFLSDSLFRETWVNNQLANIKIFIKDLLGYEIENSSELAAKAILERLRHFSRQNW